MNPHYACVRSEDQVNSKVTTNAPFELPKIKTDPNYTYCEFPRSKQIHVMHV